MAYFVPCTTAFEDAVKDKQSLRYWKVLIDIDDDDVLEDVTEYIDNNDVSGNGKLEGASNEAVSNQYKVTLRNVSGIFKEGDFAFAKCEIQAKVGTAEYITIFTGFVDEEGCARSVSVTSDDTVVVTMFDRSKHIAMRRKVPDAVYVNMKISDSAAPSSSLFHQLAYLLGLSDSDLVLGGAIDYTKPYLKLDGNARAWSELQALAIQYLGQLTFRYDGKLLLRSRHETGYSAPSSEWTFSEDENNIHSVKMRGGKIIANRVITEFDVHTVLDQRKIYRNVQGYNIVTGKCSIQVQPGEYWPGEAVNTDVAELKYLEPDTGEEYPIAINVQTPTIGASGSGSDIECDGGVLTLESFNGVAGTTPASTQQNPGSSQIILYNGTGGVVTITKLDLYGQPIRVDQKVIVRDQDATITNEWEFRDKTIIGKYAVSPAQATITTQWWVEYGKVKRKYYEIETDWIPQIQEGALVDLVMPTYDINMTCEVMAWNHPAAKGPMGKQITKLTLREWINLTPAADPENTNYQGQGLATTEGVDDTSQVIETKASYSDLQNGYDEEGGTTTPAVPVIILCEAVGKNAIFLMADYQLALTNFKRYEWQVSADSGGSPSGGWYELEFDGTDWKDQADPFFTSVESPTFSHTNIPYTGTADNPAGRKLHYRCRRVNKDDTKSAWSSTSSATSKIVDSGDLAVNSVYAGNIIASEINTLLLRATAALIVGFGGVGSNSSPEIFDRRVVVDDDEFSSQEYTPSGWVKNILIGGSSGGRLLTTIKANGVYSNQGLSSSELLPAGTFYLWDFENQDLNSVKKDAYLTGSNYSFQPGKFGSYCIFGGGTPPYQTAISVSDDAADVDTDFSMSGWVNGSGTVSFRVFRFGGGSNYFQLVWDHSGTQIRLEVSKGGVTTNSSYYSISNNVWYHVGVTYDSSTNTATIVVNDDYEEITPSGTWGTQAGIFRVDLASNDGFGNVFQRYLDDFAYSTDTAITVNDLIKHYNNNVAWQNFITKNDVILRADGDIILNPINGGIIFDIESNDECLGLPFMIAEANRPSSWVLSAGTATTWTTVDFSNYVPFGVTSLKIKLINSWTGDGAIDDVYVDIRKYGSTVTNRNQVGYMQVGFTNLASGTNKNHTQFIDVLCDEKGRIEYQTSNSANLVYMTVYGYTKGIR